MKAAAKKLREEDARKNTQKRVAELFGVARNTVSTWFMPNVKYDKRHTQPDARVSRYGHAVGSQMTPNAPRPADMQRQPRWEAENRSIAPSIG